MRNIKPVLLCHQTSKWTCKLCTLKITKNQSRLKTTYNHFISPPNQTLPPPATHNTKTFFRLAIKDNITTPSLPTTCSSSLLPSHSSPLTATIITQLLSLGAHIVGKTNMDEFGMGSHSVHSPHGPVLNPLDTTRSAGGSSGGSAVAVAVGDADVALGTDTGGSIRLPAAYTGVVGYKPSYGMLSRYGVVPYANSLDTVGLLASNVRTIRQLVLDTNLYMEHDPKDPTSLPPSTRTRCSKACPPTLSPLSGITIGIPLEYNITELHPTIRQAWLNAATTLASHGATITPVSLPTTKQALCAYYVLAPAEASSNLSKYDGVRYGARSPLSDAAGSTLYSDTRSLFGDEVKRRILLGTYSLSSEAMDNYFLQAQKVRRLVQRDFDRVFKLPNPLYEAEPFDLSDIPPSTTLQDKTGPAQVDFLLCPTAPTFPPKLSDVEQESVEGYMNDVFTVPASLAGLPAVSVPVRGGGLPVGLQVVGQFWDDGRVLGMAEKLEALMNQ